MNLETGSAFVRGKHPRGLAGPPLGGSDRHTLFLEGVRLAGIARQAQTLVVLGIPEVTTVSDGNDVVCALSRGRTPLCGARTAVGTRDRAVLLFSTYRVSTEEALTVLAPSVRVATLLGGTPADILLLGMGRAAALLYQDRAVRMSTEAHSIAPDLCRPVERDDSLVRYT